MENRVENNEEIVIDFGKIYRILSSRILWILGFIVISLIFSYVYTGFMPKKYSTDAKIFINKAEDTNLIEINPFAISDSGGIAGGDSGLSPIIAGLSGGVLANDLEILKSPLVMERVIRENGFKYNAGPKKGEYINANSFINDKNLDINTVKNTKSIRIAFKSTNPTEPYRVVSSIINSYKGVYESINSKKASKDKEFLEKSYISAQKTLNEKIARLKELKSKGATYTTGDIGGTFGLLGMYNKRLGEDLSQVAQGSVEVKKMESDVDQEFDKIKILKKKLEWITLVENMSKNVSNITVLKEPELKESYENVEPNLNFNLSLAFVISIIIGLFMVIALEIFSRKLTYSNMDDKTVVITSNNKDISNLKTNVLINGVKNLSVVSLAANNRAKKFVESLKEELQGVNISFTDEKSSLDGHIKNIMSAESIVYIGQLGYTERKLFNQVRNVCKDLGKKVINNFLFA